MRCSRNMQNMVNYEKKDRWPRGGAGDYLPTVFLLTEYTACRVAGKLTIQPAIGILACRYGSAFQGQLLP